MLMLYGSDYCMHENILYSVLKSAVVAPCKQQPINSCKQMAQNDSGEPNLAEHNGSMNRLAQWLLDAKS